MEKLKYDKNMIVSPPVFKIMILVGYQKSKSQYQNHINIIFGIPNNAILLVFVRIGTR